MQNCPDTPFEYLVQSVCGYFRAEVSKVFDNNGTYFQVGTEDPWHYSDVISCLISHPAMSSLPEQGWHSGAEWTDWHSQKGVPS